jgi:hypothetical protein
VYAALPCREDVLSLLGPASPQAVSDARDQTGPTPFLAILQSWCEALEDERRLTPCRRNVRGMVDRLTQHLTWVCEQSFAGDFFEEIEELLRVFRRITLTEGRRPAQSQAACAERTPDVRQHGEARETKTRVAV